MAASDGIARAKQLAEGLFPHQVDGLAFLLARRRSILADDMGLGKTRQSVLAMRTAVPEGPYLVVCPASVKRNWAREIALALGERSDVLVLDSRSAIPEGYRGWLVINYDILRKRLDDLAPLPVAGYVFDEAHYLKNHTSQRSKAARALLEGADGDPVVHCLTGTPLTSRPRDLFPLLQLVRHPLGRSFLGFAKRYCDAEKGEYGWITDGASNIEELTVQLHGTMLRRRKDEVLDLPEKLRTWITVDTSASDHAPVKDLLVRLVERRHEADLESRIDVLSRLAPVRKQIAVSKVKHTIEFVEGIVDQGVKVVVFTCFTPPVGKIAGHFGGAALSLSGKTPANRRQGIVDAFQNDDSVRVLVANIIAGGVGINLTAAGAVVFNDLDWVPVNHWQAEDRAHRIGQKHPVNVYYFSARGTVDEFVSEVLETKSRIIGAIVDGEALDGNALATRDVLSELQSLLHEVAPQLSETDASDEEGIQSILRGAARRYRETHRADGQRGSAAGAKTGLTEASIEALARALVPPKLTSYRTANSKGDGFYRLDVDGGDVLCSCRGFEFRGQCKHARALKQALAADGQIPEAYESV